MNGAFIIERYELKYRIAPELVAPIRAAIARYCLPDPASRAGPYLISSLYLDSPERLLYRLTRDNRSRRFKLRIRRYVDGPYFLEVKRKEKDVIIKSRAPVPTRLWPSVLFDPAVIDDPALSVRDRPKVQDFVTRMQRYRCGPCVIVRYGREAYASEADDYARVTFDHRLVGRAARTWDLPILDDGGWTPMDDPTRFGLPVSGVVLELKCTTQVPLWMSDLVRRFQLVRAGFSKYCSAVEATDRFPEDPWQGREPAHWIRKGMV